MATVLVTSFFRVIRISGVALPLAIAVGCSSGGTEGAQQSMDDARQPLCYQDPLEYATELCEAQLDQGCAPFGFLSLTDKGKCENVYGAMFTGGGSDCVTEFDEALCCLEQQGACASECLGRRIESCLANRTEIERHIDDPNAQPPDSPCVKVCKQQFAEGCAPILVTQDTDCAESCAFAQLTGPDCVQAQKPLLTCQLANGVCEHLKPGGVCVDELQTQIAACQ